MLIASERPIPDISTAMTWAQTSRLPLAVLTPEMRSRQVIDTAFARNDVQLVLQVETDSSASLHAHMRTGRWANIVSHMWVRTITPSPRIRIRIAGRSDRNRARCSCDQCGFAWFGQCSCVRGSCSEAVIGQTVRLTTWRTVRPGAFDGFVRYCCIHSEGGSIVDSYRLVDF